MKEKPFRSFLKGLTWRITATTDTFIISYLVTGKLKFAISISFIEFVTKLTLYFVHERIWNRVKMGRQVLPDYEI
jgi:uncharacterized membrane protein